MEYVRLGKTGLKVSRLCFGCMTYGTPEKGSHTWALNEEQSRPFIKKALELGIDFFDTANVYSGGASEEVLESIKNWVLAHRIEETFWQRNPWRYNRSQCRAQGCYAFTSSSWFCVVLAR
jgi:aryl-alcohol dehydrogenase-like predicted oxidoreductase